MAAGYRGLLAFWAGGAGSSAPSTQAGYRSLLAPWAGGAASDVGTTQAGIRSMLAPWVGGAGIAPTASAGIRSLLAFWAGGGSALEQATAGPTPGEYGSPSRPKRRVRRVVHATPANIVDDEEELAALRMLGVLKQ